MRFLSDNEILKSNQFSKEYSGQSILKFFEKDKDILDKDRERRKSQKLDDVTSLYDHNYGKCILQCVHKGNQNLNVYIPGIIWVGLCYTMPLVMPIGLFADDLNVNVFNSKDKAYNDDPVFQKCLKLTDRTKIVLQGLT